MSLCRIELNAQVVDCLVLNVLNLRVLSMVHLCFVTCRLPRARAICYLINNPPVQFSNTFEKIWYKLWIESHPNTAPKKADNIGSK
jgi:hypothetical protein